MGTEPRTNIATADLAELDFLERLERRLPEDISLLHALAEMYTKTGRYESGLKVDLQLCSLLPDNPIAWYNLGCSQALLDQKDEAMESLSRAVDLGFDDYDGMKSDSDLSKLSEDPRFESLLSWLYTVCSEEDA